MADDQVEQVQDEQQQQQQVVEQVEEKPPHPLEEGGARFKEVYGQMKEFQRELERERAERAAERAALQQQRPQPQVQYTPEQVAAYLQQQVDRGAMTPMDAANMLSQFNAQRVATQTALQVEQTRLLNQQLQEAANEVNQYIAKVPALRDSTSAEFAKVSDAAHRVSRRMGLPVTDFRVQQTALENVYGGLDRIARQGEQRREARDASLPHVETGTQKPSVVTAGKQDDALKGVPEEYVKFWTSKGYTRERMIEEAKYVTRAPRQMPARSR